MKEIPDQQTKATYPQCVSFVPVFDDLEHG